MFKVFFILLVFLLWFFSMLKLKLFGSLLCLSLVVMLLVFFDMGGWESFDECCVFLVVFFGFVWFFGVWGVVGFWVWLLFCVVVWLVIGLGVIFLFKEVE